MPRTLFQKSRLDQKAKKCFKKIDHLLAEDMIEPVKLFENMNALIDIINDPEFQLLNRSLKKRINTYYKKCSNRYIDLINPIQELNETLFQVPSSTDLAQMRSMPAGDKEDQQTRLTNMTRLVDSVCELPVITTDTATLEPYWYELFEAIELGNIVEAQYYLSEIPFDDPVLEPLLETHSPEYLEELIDHSIEAVNSSRKIKELPESDLTITPKTFEILIKDLATTLQHSAKMHFSFGLPTHHAYGHQGSGFCLLNKTATLMRNATLTHEDPLKYIVIGLDVNRDNGLCDILKDLFSEEDVYHLDIFASNVYPHHDKHHINSEFGFSGTSILKGVDLWHQDLFHYFAIDLSQIARQNDGIHPALVFALEQTILQVIQAKTEGKNIALYIPLGWDSHQNETAPCGKMVDGRWLTPKESYLYRFNNRDFEFFYKRIMRLYNENKEHITGVYWGIEGGYNPHVYEHQIRLIADSLKTNHLLPEAEPLYPQGPSSSMSR